MLEKWNDGMAPFGQINAYGGDYSPQASTIRPQGTASIFNF
jgi:hypothetical protein